MEGTVKWFNKDKGYGFITDEEDRDIFVHYTQILMDGFRILEQGERVSFDVLHSERGPQAQNVRKILCECQSRIFYAADAAEGDCYDFV